MIERRSKLEAAAQSHDAPDWLVYPEIVTILDAPVLTRAGPGAGKTFLLGARLKWLLENGHAGYDDVLLLAYGRDAALSMYDKLTDPKGKFRLDRVALREKVSTIHSLGKSIIDRDPSRFGLTKKYRLQEDDDVRALLFRDAGQILDLPDDVSEQADDCKTLGRCAYEGGSPKCRLCDKYDEIMRKCDRIDFDDQILLAVDMLDEDAALRTAIQASTKHVLVDEYQDINHLQKRLLHLISGAHPNGVFLIGDEYQSIYSFRGGSPQYIMNADADFPGIRVHRLNASNRCHRNILQNAAKVLMAHTQCRDDPSSVKYERDAATLGPTPYVWQFYSLQFEAEAVASIAAEFLSQKKDVLVLVPRGTMYRPIAKAMDDMDVPYSGPVPSVAYGTADRLKSAERLSRWLCSPTANIETRLVMEELLNQGACHVPGGDRNYECLPATRAARILAEKSFALLWDDVKRGKRTLLTAARKASDPHQSLRAVIRVMDRLLAAHSGEDCAMPGRLLARMSCLAAVWDDAREFAKDMVSIRQAIRPGRRMSSHNVLLTTMKKAKGLEAHVVIIPGAEKGMVPDTQPNADADEETRLFYVSMTRAKERLFLFHSLRRPGSQTRPGTQKDEGAHDMRSRSPYLETMGFPSVEMTPKLLDAAVYRFRQGK